MRKISFAIFICLSICCIHLSWAQTSMAYLESQFPKLTNLFSEELGNAHTHYIIAVDVSGSMKKYDEVVTPVLQSFANALPEGELVSIIPFGTDAKSNTPGLCVKINSDAERTSLHNALSTLYTNDSYTTEFKRNTDVNKAIAAVNKAILNNKDVDMNVVIILTDFLNDLPGQGEVKLTEGNLESLSKEFNNLTNNTYSRVVAMRLPKAGSGKGYCLDQLQDNVFNQQNQLRRFETVDVINDPGTIKTWFDQLSRDIMTDKLRGVIRLYNERKVSPSLTTETDIDGNTKVNIQWVPNKMYTSLRLGKISPMPGSEFKFKGDTASYTTIMGDTIIELGQIKHRNWGYHNFDEDLNIDVELPTDFDNELQTLSIEKPFSNTTIHPNRFIWTFIFTFLTSCVILGLLLIYIWLLYKAMRRNSKEILKSKIDIRDAAGTILASANISKGNSLNIGKNGSGQLSVPNADWNIFIQKAKSNPLLFWKKPNFRWKSTGSGRVRSRNALSGFIGRYNNPSKSITVDCFDTQNNKVNSVRILLKD